MEDKTAERMLRTLAPLASLYPHWKPSEATWEVYALALADLDPQLLQDAIVELVVEPRDFMPMPGHIRQAAFRLVDQAEHFPDAYTAWSQIMLHFQNGSNMHPWTIEVAGYLGGVKAIGQSDNVVAERARFIDAFKALNDRRQRQQRMLPQTRKAINRLAAERKQLARPNDTD